MSELECFHSPVLDMDYIFLTWGLFVGHLLGGRSSVAVRKWSLQTVSCEERRCDVKRRKVHLLLEKMVTQGHEKCETCTL